MCLCRAVKTEMSNKKFAFVVDNVPVQTSSDIEDFIQRAGLQLLTIAPYSPALNLSECVINCIKIQAQTNAI